MRKFIGGTVCTFVVLVAALAFGQSTMQPGINTPLMGCVEGRALRIVNGYPACSTTVPPTVSNCGAGAALSPQSTDFVGQATTGTGTITSCLVTFSKLYNNFGCLAQTNSSSSLLAGTPVIGSSGGKTTMTLTLTLSMASGKITYVCFPV